MKTSKITIACIDKPREVECYRYGKFAVHLSNYEGLWQAERDSCYGITHVATGRLAAVKCGRAEAQRLAKALDALIDREITEADVTGKSARYKAYRTAAKSLIEQAGAIT